MAEPVLMAVGCYTEAMGHVKGTPGQGIHFVALDRETGALESRHVVTGARNPSYLAINPAGDRLYSVEELDQAGMPNVLTYALDRETGTLTQLSSVPSPGSAACHIYVTRDAEHLFVSNYVTGDLLGYRLDPEGIPQGPAQVVGRPGNGTARMHCAMETPDGGVLLVNDAGNDTIGAYTITGAGVDPTPAFEIKMAPGSFPRHIATIPGQATVLVAHEYSNDLGIVRVSGKRAEIGKAHSALPVDWSGKSFGAAVRYHPNGRFGYMTNRGHDSIFGAAVDHDTLTLSPIGHWKSGGQIPRDFAIDASGRWLVAAHQNSNDLIVFSVDPASGQLSQTEHRLSTGSPVSVLFLE
jgi:6-phosphogluconolactonase